jgi:hypothetical protein
MGVDRSFRNPVTGGNYIAVPNPQAGTVGDSVILLFPVFSLHDCLPYTFVLHNADRTGNFGDNRLTLRLTGFK